MGEIAELFGMHPGCASVGFNYLPDLDPEPAELRLHFTGGKRRGAPSPIDLDAFAASCGEWEDVTPGNTSLAEVMALFGAVKKLTDEDPPDSKN